MDDLRQDSQTGLPTEYFALCTEHFEPSCLLGHQWISRGFTSRKVQCDQHTRSQKIPWTMITQEIREDLQIDFFPRKVSMKNPPKNRFLLVGLFEIYFRSSEMTDPRPCPRGWAYFRVPSRSTKTWQAQTNSIFISAAKIDIFGGQKNITGQNTPSPNVYRTLLKKKWICPESSLNNIKASSKT